MCFSSLLAMIKMRESMKHKSLLSSLAIVEKRYDNCLSSIKTSITAYNLLQGHFVYTRVQCNNAVTFALLVCIRDT